MVALNDTFASVAEACEAINHLMASPIGSIRQIPNIISSVQRQEQFLYDPRCIHQKGRCNYHHA